MKKRGLEIKKTGFEKKLKSINNLNLPQKLELQEKYVKTMNKLQLKFMIFSKDKQLQITNDNGIELWNSQSLLKSENLFDSSMSFDSKDFIQMEKIAMAILLKKSKNEEIKVPNFSIDTLLTAIEEQFLDNPITITHKDMIIFSSILHVSLFQRVEKIYCLTNNKTDSIKQAISELTKNGELSKIMKKIYNSSTFENQFTKELFKIIKNFTLFLEKTTRNNI